MDSIIWSNFICHFILICFLTSTTYELNDVSLYFRCQCVINWIFFISGNIVGSAKWLLIDLFWPEFCFFRIFVSNGLHILYDISLRIFFVWIFAVYWSNLKFSECWIRLLTSVLFFFWKKSEMQVRMWAFVSSECSYITN